MAYLLADTQCGSAQAARRQNHPCGGTHRKSECPGSSGRSPAGRRPHRTGGRSLPFCDLANHTASETMAQWAGPGWRWPASGY
eukprot:865706-Rhodomonas_salina.1